jgi:hypothetical protein
MQRLYDLRKAKNPRLAANRQKRTPPVVSQMKRTVRRSRGCRTCRGRKYAHNLPSNPSECPTDPNIRVKCDEEKPACLRCRRSELQCEGYDDPIFLDEGPRLERRASGTAGSSPDRSGSEMPGRTVLSSTEAYYVQFLVEKLKIGVVGDGYEVILLRPDCR